LAKFRFVQWLWDWLSALEAFRFEWDAGNRTKSVQKHAVTCREAEEVFIERRFVPLGEQVQPPCPEPRYAVLGETADLRRLLVVFTVRARRIRVISARPMNRREREFYVSLREE